MSAVKKTRPVKSSLSKKHVRRANPMRSRKAKGKRIVFARTDDGPVGAGDHNG